MNHRSSVRILVFLSLTLCFTAAHGGEREALDKLFPIRGFCIEAPRTNGMDEFIAFIRDELAPRHVNTLILRVDYRYEFESHPNVRDRGALSKAHIQRLTAACREHGIRVIPQINLLGHQSGGSNTLALLREFPEFDETPHVKTENYTRWPNPDGLYCKSYCPLHPEVHRVVFALMDEICDVFEADAFHAGMDEVFYLGDDKCPRCAGKDKSVLFAGEVQALRDRLALKGRKLWIWGDRLIDGRTTGIGMWEGSHNDTHRAIDMIPKDVMICDWHYERPDPTAVYFAMKGFNVVTCPWRNPDVAVKQAQDMARFRTNSARDMRERFQGMMQTVWSGSRNFLERDYRGAGSTNSNNPWNTFKALSGEMDRLSAAQGR